MDFSARSLPRLAYSFPSGTCDLSEFSPGCCVHGDDDSTMAVMLESDWHHLLPRLKDLGGVLASAVAGPLSLAQTWMGPDFAPVPGTRQMLDLAGGAELELRPLRRIMAVVEQGHSGQEIISLQFFDDQASGGLKVLLTNLSDRDAFADLVREFASPFPPNPSGSSAAVPPAPSPRHPQAGSVRGLWNGLNRTHPDSAFPGLPDCSRLSALEAAGPDFAWAVSSARFRAAFSAVTATGAGLRVAVRNRILFSPGSLVPASVSSCSCGITWFSQHSQLTLRRQDCRWVVTRHEGDVLRAECYLPDGSFAGQVALDESAPDGAADRWRGELRAGDPPDGAILPESGESRAMPPV